MHFKAMVGNTCRAILFLLLLIVQNNLNWEGKRADMGVCDKNKQQIGDSPSLCTGKGAIEK